MLTHLDAGALRVAYEESGPADGTPVVLLHGFPYDAHAYDDVTPILAAAGCRVIALAGVRPHAVSVSGHTAFRPAGRARPRSCGTLGCSPDSQGGLAGYDWGGRAACIVAALWPERVAGLVSGGGYNIQFIPGAMQPQSPAIEHQYWYQYYFHSERGRAGLQQNRHELCKYIWRLWSPGWKFDDETYDRTATAFDNPDFVDVAIHSYRHRFGLVPGDPAVESTEHRLAERPPIQVPTVVLHGGNSGFTTQADPERERKFFTGNFTRRHIAAAGHNLPQEAPKDFASAVLSLVQGTAKPQ